MEDKEINEKESLELITQMIQSTQHRFEKNSGGPFLIWGYLTTILSFTIWFLFKITYPEWGSKSYMWQYLWFILPVVGGISTFLISRNNEQAIRTYIDKVTKYIWLVFGIAGFVISCISMFLWSTPILFIILLIMGMGTTLTGLVIKHKVVTVCGALGTLGSLSCLFISGIDQNIAFGISFIIMMIIPGHVLNRAAHNQKNM